ncbi:hypothetical protein A2U01_0047776, partial [Trifolium medium]|nr:hypothetical protein [Trifolium medium]
GNDEFEAKILPLMEASGESYNDIVELTGDDESVKESFGEKKINEERGTTDREDRTVTKRRRRSSWKSHS